MSFTVRALSAQTLLSSYVDYIICIICKCQGIYIDDKSVDHVSDFLCVCVPFGPIVKTKGKAWQLGPLRQHCPDRCLLYLSKQVCKRHG